MLTVLPYSGLWHALGALGVFAAIGAAVYFLHELSWPARNLDGPPPASIIFGHQRELLRAPHGSLQKTWFARYGDTLRYVGMWRRPVILTIDPLAVRHVHQHSEIFLQPESIIKFALENQGPSLIGVEGPAHRRQRRAIAPSFGPAQIRHMTPMLLDKAYELSQKLSSMPGQVDLVKVMHQLTVDVIGLAAFDCDFGAMRGEGNELLEAWKRMMMGNHDSGIVTMLQRMGVPLSGFLKTERSESLENASSMMKRIGQRLIDDKRRRVLAEVGLEVKKADLVEGDLISNILRANVATDVKESQRMSDEEVLAQIPLFLFAGNTTVAVTLTWAAGLLSKHANIAASLRQEVQNVATDRPDWDTLDALPYLDAFVRELLRVYPAAPTLFRVAKTATIVPLARPVRGRNGYEMDHVTVSKGDTIHIDYGRMNLDPAVWGRDAETFKPERFLQKEALGEAIQTFGGGVRHCIGSRFAIAEIKAVLFALCREVTFSEVDSRPEFTKFGGLGLVRPKVGGKVEMPLIVSKAI